jgi:uncharacterized protein
LGSLKYFASSYIVSFIGLILGAGVGWYYDSTLLAVLNSVFLVFVLSILEVSISFDNAVVNATVLKKMTPLWKHRFLTWGMLIAVFGMRLVFPLLIVAVTAHVGPWDALVMAATNPNKYAELMLAVEHEVAAFGGTFLLLVALKYFIDHEKDTHWIRVIEAPLAKLGKLESVEIGIAILLLLVVSRFVAPEEQLAVLVSGLAGALTFLAVEVLGSILKPPNTDAMGGASMSDLHKMSAGLFLYLEVLDASFSFDGVVGAFAITNNLFLIAIGLGIGAMFVRSLTIYMVDKGTLSAFRYLEHGAFWAVTSLALIMFTNMVTHIPEYITALLGAGLIGLSLKSSMTYLKNNPS